jgi:hypothetical protein
MACVVANFVSADFVSSPPNRHAPLPARSPSESLSQKPREEEAPEEAREEPLLSLLTTSHPLLATTIEGATSAYNNSKNFSPRFKSGAEYVEGYLGPIANTVGNVGRATGVEGGVRWFLGAGRRHQSLSSDLEAGDLGSHKRRKVDDGSHEAALDPAADRALSNQPAETDLYGFTKDRRMSMSTVDTLPAYDEQRSPSYAEVTENRVASRPSSSSSASAAWQQRLIMSTSGLSVAMSEESLRSLKYCLDWLRWANDHIARVINALKTTLDEFDSPTHNKKTSHGGQDSDDATLKVSSTTAAEESHSPQERGELAVRINALKNDVLKTLRDVIDTVSRYAGGALPENARVLVRRHLTSLPQRFRLAAMNDSSAEHQRDGAKEKEMREGARKVLVLAKEGLDMVTQVSGVLDGTIVSAEEWCERLGKKRREERAALTTAEEAPPAPLSSVVVDEDMKMG